MAGGRVISVINMKGGVGKTTLTIGIADQLSNQKNILVIDADPQFNATQAFITTYKSKKKIKWDTIIDDTKVEAKESDNNDDTIDEDNESEVTKKDENTFYNTELLAKQKTIFHLFAPQTSVTQSYKVPKADSLIINIKKNLDLLAGDLNLVLANNSTGHGLVKRIKNFIEDNNLKEKYDYIFIDCPPTLTIYTDSALMASDYYLIPNRIDRYSIIGIESLQTAIQNLIDEERITLKSLGIVYTMLKTNLNKKQLQIKTDFESKETVHDLEIFNAVSHEVNHIQYGMAGPLPTRYKTSKEDIEAIIAEMQDKINRLEEINNDK